MKLVDILARELKVWPEGVAAITQGIGTGVLRDSSHQKFGPEIYLELASDAGFADYGRPNSAIVSRAEWQAAVDALNAPKVVEWDGFPIAGVACEFTTNAGHSWKECKILFADDVSILTGETEGKADRRLLRKCDADVGFRKIRTPDQVAAEEIQDIESWLDANIEELGAIAKTLHKSGFRKQVEK